MTPPVDPASPASSASEPPCLLDPDLTAKCVTHDTPCDWVECTGWRCPVSGLIVTAEAPEAASSPSAGRGEAVSLLKNVALELAELAERCGQSAMATRVREWVAGEGSGAASAPSAAALFNALKVTSVEDALSAINGLQGVK